MGSWLPLKKYGEVWLRYEMKWNDIIGGLRGMCFF